MSENLPEYKIKKNPIDVIDNPIILFGDWINNISDIRTSYLTSKPFPFVIIDNFLNNDVAEIILSEFPNQSDERWLKYCNALEYKYVMDNLDHMGPETFNLFYAYCHDKIIEKIRTITDIPNLEYDPYLHGAGLHYHPRGGHLAMHLDYGIHPFSKKERRVNIIMFLNKDWIEEYGGHLEIWSNGLKKLEHKVTPVFNRAILFRTSDESWHGVPDKILCPIGTGRKSIAIYYVSQARENATPRYKASFVQRPTEQYDDNFVQLASIRQTRRITNDDLKQIYGDDYEKIYPSNP